MTAIGVVLTVVVAVVTGVVLANWSGHDVKPKAEAPSVAAPQPSALPSQATIDACNQHAAAQSSQRSNTREIVIDGAIGAAAGGGSGAGKGAVIGGVLYGVNENRKNDAQYRDVYATCMRARGYNG